MEQLDNINLNKDLGTLKLKKSKDFWVLKVKTLNSYRKISMLDQIFLICNQILLYLRINYISPCVLFAADWMLIQLDKE